MPRGGGHNSASSSTGGIRVPSGGGPKCASSLKGGRKMVLEFLEEAGESVPLAPQMIYCNTMPRGGGHKCGSSSTGGTRAPGGAETSMPVNG